jgi:hypothetical protein
MLNTVSTTNLYGQQRMLVFMGVQASLAEKVTYEQRLPKTAGKPVGNLVEGTVSAKSKG